MRRVLLYISLFLLLSTAVTSFGWYLSCNKPCDPEIIEVKGDTVFIQPTPIAVTPPDSAKKPKQGFIARIFHKDEHKVKEGENLYRIGLKYGLTAEELRLANKLQNYDIKAGQWLKIPAPSSRDTVYTYAKEFGDSTVKGTVYTQSYGAILSQSVTWESLAYKEKNRLFMGASLDDKRNLHGMGAYEFKSGWMVTGQIGVFDRSYQVGVLKRFK